MVPGIEEHMRGKSYVWLTVLRAMRKYVSGIWWSKRNEVVLRLETHRLLGDRGGLMCINTNVSNGFVGIILYT